MPSKKILAKFSFPQKIPDSKNSKPKKSLDHPCHLKSGVKASSVENS